ncbi:hypothetical protein [Diaphorobacter ruginosibacter]|uniref:hypothetical protein n=1 Tax=Diaphorobacter ruginosibacter TaxID=1715720 RepID=UPI001FE29AA8|nr:hypothetical protein [Diaphorobacter ruginosibacter]
MTTNKLIESLHGDPATLHDAGAIDKVTMGEFDAICLRLYVDSVRSKGLQAIL